MNTAIKRTTAINYFGGKARYLDWLLPLFPPVNSYMNYIEPFCGSAVVFLNKEASSVETINDMDGRLLNFFRVLRERPDELIAQLELTLYSRCEFQHAQEKAEDPLEDARRFFVRAMQSFGGQCDTQRRINSWRVQMSEARRGVSMAVSKWLTKIDGLLECVTRFKMAQIENHDFEYVLDKFNLKDSFTYCDPPYDLATRTGTKDYKHEFTREDTIRLAKCLNNFNGMAALSAYDFPLMDLLYPKEKWMRHLGPARATNLGKQKKASAREMLYTNYDPNKFKGIFKLEF